MRHLLPSLALLLALSARGQSLYFPPVGSAEWATLAPDSAGYCQPRVDSLYDFLESQNTRAFLLLKNGRIVLERYFGAFTADSAWYWASAGKTLTAALVGVAQQEGLLSLQDPTSDYLGTGWTSLSPTAEAAITVRHQLTMTSGLNDAGNLDCTDPACLTYLAEPGTRWAYHNAPYTLLTEVVAAASGQSLNAFTFSRVRNPIGMDGAYLPSGFNRIYFSTPRAMARFGLLLLAGGTWEGTAILDSAYLGAMTQPSQTLNRAYGYLTWLNAQESYMVPQLQVVFPGPPFPAAPPDAYVAMGKNGQLINVVPSEGLVWVRMGDAPPGAGGLVSVDLNEAIWQRVSALPCVTSQPPTRPLPNVTVSPVPTHRWVRVSAPAPPQKLVVVDIWGRPVRTLSPRTATATLDLSELPAGVYLLRYRTHDGQTGQRRIVKVN